MADLPGAHLLYQFGISSMTRLCLDLEWRTTALTVVLLPVLAGLGFWQLERADEKAGIAEQNRQRAAAAPVDLDRLEARSPEALAFRRVRVSGFFLAEPIIYLDNQIRDGRYGHDVLGLFVHEASGEAVLLNRGWLPGDPARRSLPEVTVPATPLSLEATVYVPPGEQYVLSRETFDALAPAMLVQQSASRALREVLEVETGYTLFPRELRLAPDQPAGFRRDWPVVNVSPSKHQGYALQWFTMAAVLFVFFVFRSSNLASVLGFRDRSGASET